MAKQKVTVTLDRKKAQLAQEMVGAKSLSETIETALDRVIRAEQLRRDVSVYAGRPLSDEELAIADLPVRFDLDDDAVDYDALYGKRR